MDKKLLWLYALSASIYFGQGIEGLPSSAFFFYLKETLHFDESKIMWLGSIISVAWLVKPFIGFLIDKLKFTNKTWILVSLICSTLITLFLGMSSFVTLPIMVGLMMLGSWNSAVRDVAADGLMCVKGKELNLTGKIQSIQWIAITIASMLVGVGGGFIAEKFNYQMGYLLLIPFYTLMIYVVSQYRNPEPKAGSIISFVNTLRQLFLDKNLLIVAFFILLYKFAPSFGTPLTFIMRDQFHWSKLWIGTLETIGSAVSILGALAYYKYSSKIDMRKALYWSVFIGAITTVMYLYFTPVSCVIYDIIGGFVGMAVQLLLLDFMARNTKSGMEATSFALLCSVSNLAGTLDNIMGAWLYPIIGLSGLILISSASSFLCLLLINKLRLDK